MFNRIRRLIDSSALVLNKVTAYENVEIAKAAVKTADNKLLSSRQAVRQAKDEFESVSTNRIRHQQELNSLLHRKPNWTSQELAEFTQLVGMEHDLERREQQAKKQLALTEYEFEHAQTNYLNLLREHYHQEQLWSEKGRRLSTYTTLTLILFNTILFMISVSIIEPGKRKKVAEQVALDNQKEIERITSNLHEKLNEIQNTVAQLQLAESPQTLPIANANEKQQQPSSNLNSILTNPWVPPTMTVAALLTIIGISMAKK